MQRVRRTGDGRKEGEKKVEYAGGHEYPRQLLARVPVLPYLL
jgi:hypothetical protein